MAEAKKLTELKENFIKASKRILISRELSRNTDTLESQLNDITDTYNDYIQYASSLWSKIHRDDKTFLKQQLQQLRDKLVACYEKLKCNYSIPINLLHLIDPNVKEEENQTGSSTESKQAVDPVDIESESDDENSKNNLSILVTSFGDSSDNNIQDHSNTKEIQTQTEEKQETMSDLNKIEFLKLAASTVNRTFSGDPLALQSFIDSVDLLESFATTNDLKTTLITFVLTKLEGKAREAIVGRPTTVASIIENLRSKIKPDSSKIIEGRIQALRIDKMSLQDFASKTDELAENFRRALIVEGIPSNKAEEMTVEKTIEMCRSNARTGLVKSVLASSTFSNHKEVVSKFIIQINTQQSEQQVLSFRSSNRNGRGGYHKNNRNFNNFNRNSNYRNNNNNNNFRNNNSRNNFRGNNRNSNNSPRNNRHNNNNNNGRDRNDRNDNYSDRNSNRANVRVAGNGDVPSWQLGAPQEESEHN